MLEEVRKCTYRRTSRTRQTIITTGTLWTDISRSLQSEATLAAAAILIIYSILYLASFLSVHLQQHRKVQDDLSHQADHVDPDRKKEENRMESVRCTFQCKKTTAK